MVFKDKVAVVTGGAQGIGRCIADEFSKAGATVCVIDKQPGRRNSRIDPVDAAIDAHFCRMKGQPKRVDLNSEMERYLSILKKSR